MHGVVPTRRAAERPSVPSRVPGWRRRDAAEACADPLPRVGPFRVRSGQRNQDRATATVRNAPNPGRAMICRSATMVASRSRFAYGSRSSIVPCTARTGHVMAARSTSSGAAVRSPSSRYPAEPVDSPNATDSATAAPQEVATNCRSLGCHEAASCWSSRIGSETAEAAAAAYACSSSGVRPDRSRARSVCSASLSDATTSGSS